MPIGWPERSARNTMLGPVTPGPDGAQQVAAVLNPSKLRWRQARAAINAACREAGWYEPIILETSVEQPGADQACEAIERGADVVIVGGGDGTLREVATGLADSGVPIGLVPLGTGNLFAYNLGISSADIEHNVHVALFGDQRHLDIGSAWFRQQQADGSAGPESDEHRFLVLAGIGRDALTVQQTTEESKRRLGWMAYIGSGLKHLAGENIPMRITVDDGEPHERELWSALVGNCGMIPAGIDVIPDAILDDGKLDLLEVQPRNIGSWVPIGLKGLLHLNGDIDGLAYQRVSKVLIQPSVPMPLQLDGDLYDQVVAVRATVQRHAMTMRVLPMDDDEAQALEMLDDGDPDPIKP